MTLILGIESSCDESACAVVRDGVEVLSNAVASQIARHAAHGGVVPELAAREHLSAFPRVLDEALEKAQVKLSDIDGIAVTQGPGLIPALLVGINFAKGLALRHRKPLYGVNHFAGHVYGAFLEGDRSRMLEDAAAYPMLALVVSGGHSSLLLLHSDGHARHLGFTIDDAAGEALDKAAKLLHLGYPGGPVMQKTAVNGDCKRFNFPRPLTGAAGKALSEENRYNFSFSGIKTALLYTIEKLQQSADEAIEGQLLADLAASFQEAVVDVLVRKALKAIKDFQVKTLVTAGGVACNARLRERLQAEVPKNVQLLLAPPAYCTDNAAMIGGLGYYHYLADNGRGDGFGFDAFARLPEITAIRFAGQKYPVEG
ncbi:MAG: tRNA (adenosine(37)-N6)-threonylcarbamoyltransferase complex transferase subunit TsaD [Lentisphaerae bacterium]|nr:tRNA (adenosine(37)-N6)-threonylcarbamoyltransferase complex transferase subunit TsaD [Lentisphaerota bacterium]